MRLSSSVGALVLTFALVVILAGGTSNGRAFPSWTAGENLSHSESEGNVQIQSTGVLSLEETQGQLDALVSVYSKFNGESWFISYNWNNESACFCRWYGVGCYESDSCDVSAGSDCNCTVESIVLPNNNLTGAWDGLDLSNLTGLSTLNLSKNSISGTIGAADLPCDSLSYVTFEENEIEGASFNCLPTKTLDLSGNRLLTVDILGASGSPEYISFKNNQLTEFVAPALSSEYLDLSINYLDSLTLEGPWNNLTQLILNENVFSSLNLTDFPNLESLRLSSNNFSTYESFDSCPESLTTLYLDNNCITSTDPEIFAGCGGLSVFSAARSCLGPVVNLTNLSNLKKLYLGGNNLVDIETAVSSSLTTIEVLHVENNALTTLPEMFYSLSLPNLSELDVSRNSLVMDERMFSKGTFPALQSYLVSHNHLRSSIPASFDLDSLTEFGARDCGIVGVETNLSTVWGTLTALDLAHNDKLQFLPLDFVAFEKLEKLDLTSCNLTLRSPYPPTIKYLHIGYNYDVASSLNLEDLVNLVDIDVSSSDLTDSAIPPSFWNSGTLVNVVLDSNKLESIPVANNLTNLRSFSARYNQIRADIASSLFANSPNLEYMLLGGNLITGNFTQFDLGLFPNLTTLQLSDNGIFGEVSPDRFCGTNVEFLELRGNSLSFHAGENCDDFGGRISKLDLGSNPLNASIDDIVDSLNYFKDTLSELYLDDCGIFGHLSTIFMDNFGFLSVLDLSFNDAIIGVLPEFRKNPFIYSIRFRGTSVSGEIPKSWGNLPGLREFDIRETRCHSSIGLPFFLEQSDSEWVLDISTRLVCPKIRGTVHNEIEANMDPDYIDYYKCICQDGYYRGDGDKCVACRLGCDCTESTESDNPLKIINCYPFPTIDRPTQIIPCSIGIHSAASSVFGEASDNEKYLCHLAIPSRVAPTNISFECQPGYHGNLCSECDEGYYGLALECLPCSKGTFLLTMVMVIAVVFLVYLIFSMPKDEIPILFALWSAGQNMSTITASYISQSLRPENLKILQILDMVTNFRPQFMSCLFGGISEHWNSFYLTVTLPFAIVGALVAIYYIGRYLINIHDEIFSARNAKRSRIMGWIVRLERSIRWTALVKKFGIKSIQGVWKRYLLYVVIWLYNFYYFPLMSMILVNFGCTLKGNDGEYFIARAPDTRCDINDPRYRTGAIVSLIAAFVYGIALPVFLFRMSGRLTASRHVSGTGESLHSLDGGSEGKDGLLIPYAVDGNFHRKSRWWYFFILFRKLLFAIGYAFIPFYSNVVSVYLFTVLQGTLFIQYLVKPYVRKIHNDIEIAASYILLFVYLGAFLAKIMDDSNYHLTKMLITDFLLLLQVVGVLVILFLAGKLIQRKYVRLRELLKPRKGAAKKALLIDESASDATSSLSTSDE